MSPPKPRLDSPAPAADDLRRELEAKILLIQEIRKDLIHSQITVLELNDTIMRKETEKADAVSILAELELALEAKITHIVELDQELNRQIAGLKQQLAVATAEKNDRDQVIQDLVQKLDQANRELGAAHTLAGNFARDLDLTRQSLQRTAGELAETAAALATTRGELAETEAVRDTLDRQIKAMEATLSWRLTRPFRKLRRMFS